MNIHLHKKKTLIFVVIVLVKVLGVLFVYLKVGAGGNSSTLFKHDRYEYLQQKKLHTIRDSLKGKLTLDKSVYELKKVSRHFLKYRKQTCLHLQTKFIFH